MTRWRPRLETALYHPIARAAAAALGRLPYVRGVHARRSFACGEVVFGASDIDLHIVVDEAPDLGTEATRLAELARVTARLKRVLLPLGQYDVTTTVELAAWYEARPYTFYRDRAWRRLAGAAAVRPTCGLRDAAARDSLLWWLFQSFELLPGAYRAGDVRTCSNLFLDVVNAAALHAGELDAPARRRDVLASWCAAEPRAPSRDAIVAGFAAAYRGRFGALAPVLYAETLRAIDRLARRTDAAGDQARAGSVLRSVDVFRDRPIRYVLVDSDHPTAVADALAETRSDPTAVVTTPAALALQLRHRNPWERAALVARNPEAAIPSVDAGYEHHAARLLAHRLVARRAGLSIGRRHDYGASTIRQLAQARLALDGNPAAADTAGLETAYRERYGTWPFVRAGSAAEFFGANYAAACAIITRLAAPPTG